VLRVFSFGVKQWEREGRGVYQGSSPKFVGTEENKTVYEEYPSVMIVLFTYVYKTFENCNFGAQKASRPPFVTRFTSGRVYQTQALVGSHFTDTLLALFSRHCVSLTTE
jgi:hypothetical protein